jgi:AmmeMemoRadiSam system protein B
MHGVPIVPLVMGHQTRATATALGDALAHAVAPHRDEVLLVASSDLSHYQDRVTAARLDRVVLNHVESCDPDGLQSALDRFPGHACGGGPIVAVMRAARALGATDASVVHYADSGDVSGDLNQVVGYMSAVIGRAAS